MHRIDGPGATVDNKFTDGDPVSGVQATIVTDDWLNDIQENIMAVLSAAGVPPTKGRAADLLDAIRVAMPGRLIHVQTHLASGTYTPTLGTRKIKVGLCGGGAGGGGATVTTGAQVSFGSGGSSGSYAEGYFTGISGPLAVVVGAGGNGVAGANGQPGGASSLGSLISANGGSAGGMFGPSAPPLVANVPPSGISITGAYLGAPSESATIGYVPSLSIGYSGQGANGKLGRGGPPQNTATTGAAGTGFGAGGGGAISFASQAVASAGGNGSPGIVIIEEYS